MELGSRLGFHDDFLIHDRVYSLNAEDMAFVRHVHANLSRNSVTAAE